MIGNVQILKNNGESLVSNGLAHFKFNDTNKQYIIYTLGEQINELLKIYIGYENAPVTDPGISDVESESITELLKKIGKNEDVSSIITILPLTAGLYHIHDKVKKVALQTSAFNNIISTQQRGQIQTLNKDEPIMKENTFFASSVTNENNNPEGPVQEQSIFANPMQPVNDAQSQQLASTEGEINATPQEVPQTPEQEQIIETQVESPTSVDTSNINNQISSNVTETSSPEANKVISDEEAKNAILAVETAQATIRENIVIIKEFIKQKNSEVLNTVDMSNTQNVEINELSSIPIQAESIPTQYDVVNNLELAPQPEVSENVLGDESNLGGGYSNDTSVNQISTGVESSSVDTNVTIPQVETTQEVAIPQVETTQEVAIPQIDTSQQVAAESIPQTPLNEQKLPAEASLPNEPKIEMIDTMAMIPQQGSSSANLNTLENVEIPKSEVINQTNMPLGGDNNISQMEEKVTANSTPQSMTQNIPTTEISNSTGMVNEPIMQNNVESQNSQNGIIDIQIPDIGLEEQMSTPSVSQGTQENIPDIPVVSSNPIENTQPQGNIESVAGGEFAIPQIDMNVSTVEQPQAPVIMPDGQSQDVNQGLVLTPDAFSKAA